MQKPLIRSIDVGIKRTSRHMSQSSVYSRLGKGCGIGCIGKTGHPALSPLVPGLVRGHPDAIGWPMIQILLDFTRVQMEEREHSRRPKELICSDVP